MFDTMKGRVRRSRKPSLWPLAILALVVLLLPLLLQRILESDVVTAPNSEATPLVVPPSSKPEPAPPPVISPPPRPTVASPPPVPCDLHQARRFTSGVVVDLESGVAVAGVWVEAWCGYLIDSDISDAHGAFSVTVVPGRRPDGPPVNLAFEHADYVERTFALNSLPAEWPWKVELERGARVRGRVLVGGDGVADVLLRLVGFVDAPSEIGRPLRFVRSTRSSADGSFEFAAVPRQPFGELRLDHDGAIAQRWTIALVNNVDDLVLYTSPDVAERAREFARLSPAARTRAARNPGALAHGHGERMPLLQLFDRERLEPLRHWPVTLATEHVELRAISDDSGRVRLEL